MGALFFGTGFVALGSEVLWTRFLALVVPNTVHTYTLTIGATLVGLVFGNAIAGLLADRLRSRALAFGTLQATSGLVVLFLMLLPAERWLALGAGPVLIAALLLVPALLSGLAFPIGVRMALANPARAGLSVGRLAALNTGGGVAGSLLIGFVSLPGLGLHASLLVLTGLSLGIGFTAWLRLHTPRPSPSLVVATLAVAFTWLILPVALGSRLPDDFLGSMDSRTA